MTPNQPQSPSKIRLAALRDELDKIKTPTYPDEFAPAITGWAAKALPIIKEDFADQLDAFQELLAKGYLSHLKMAKMAYASASTFRTAWEKDNEDALKKQHTILTFLDELLVPESP